MLQSILSEFFGGFSATITGYADGIRSTVTSLIYADGLGTEKNLSAFMVLAIGVAGFVGATGLIMGTFNWLKNLI